jgi:hypothetical protein
MNTGTSMLSGAAGGGLVSLTDRIFFEFGNKGSKGSRFLTMFGMSFVAGSMFKMQNLSAGIAGAAAYELTKAMSTGMAQNAFALSQAANFIDAESLPSVLDVSGTPMMEDSEMYLADDGSYYLSEF